MYKRFNVLLATQDVQRLQQLMKVCLKNGSGIKTILEKFCLAANDMYRPKEFTNDDIALGKYFKLNLVFKALMNNLILLRNTYATNWRSQLVSYDSVMVWCGLTYNGPTVPIFLDKGETLTSEKYCRKVLPKALDDGKKLLGDKFVFQQDGAPSHTSKKAQEWCKRRFWRFIDKQHWPPGAYRH